ncbi:hypothetical protein VKT23_016670 [Stygiomarasmius scandens]|uniref:Uncharacterized protein n=1 Tax=Marasmiellus scandens TaxID=2682957 RepID=A0ABR1IWN8_9AGAR
MPRQRCRTTSAIYTPNDNSLVEKEPQPVTTGYLWYCLRATRFPRSLKRYGREGIVKYLLLLQIFPSLQTLVLCPKTSKRHVVSFPDFDTLTFNCSRCNVAQVNNQLSPAQHDALQQVYDRYLIEKEKDEETQRLLKDFEDFIAEVGAFTSEIESSKDSGQV